MHPVLAAESNKICKLDLLHERRGRRVFLMRWKQMQGIEASRFRRLMGVQTAVFKRTPTALASEWSSSHLESGANAVTSLERFPIDQASLFGEVWCMAKGYSLDLRQRVLGALQAGEETRAQVAARFLVSVSFVRDLSRRFRTSGDVAARPYGGGRKPSVDAHTAERIKASVAACPDATIQEHRQSLARAGHPLSHSALGRALLRLELTRKKRPRATRSATASASSKPGATLRSPLLG